MTQTPRTGLRLPVVRALAPRDPDDAHRVASPLELLTDLCFVVAIAQAASGLHHAVVEGHVGAGVAGFAMAFFAIWWAWLNFTWFASAYDNDDVLYRLLTFGQIVGSLVLAAGVQGLFDGDLRLVVVGYVIMRVALIAQWLRAARGDAERRRTCVRYATGIAIVQLGWVSVLLLDHVSPLIFLGLAAAELVVPMIAESAGMTPWHPHHVAERYGLFFIIVLGETILSSTTAIGTAFTDDAVNSDRVFLVVISGVLIVFSLWWLYFARETGPVLAKIKAAKTMEKYVWGFGHYVIFASAAAVGAGLTARVDFWTGAEEGHVPALGSARPGHGPSRTAARGPVDAQPPPPRRGPAHRGPVRGRRRHDPGVDNHALPRGDHRRGLRAAGRGRGALRRARPGVADGIPRRLTRPVRNPPP